jgi:hypothetical protein
MNIILKAVDILYENFSYEFSSVKKPNDTISFGILIVK